tara:strand:- start:3969 stop:4919 length:951 start_codon:yes stop_codon:yes gene_type:complete
MITYKHADLEDTLAIIEFLKNNWSSKHIIAKRFDIFSHYYLPNNKIPNYFLALNSYNQIIGTLGYVTNKMFSERVNGNGAWLSMWCVTPGLKQPVGFNLLRTLEDNLSVDFIATLGAGLDTLPYYDKLGYITGTAEHWKCNLNDCNSLKNKLFVIDKLSSEEISRNSIGKNKEYLQNKFIKTNYYKYLTFSIYKNKEVVANVVGRVIDYSNMNIKIFRIIDIIGEIDAIRELAIYLANHEKYKFIDYIDILLGSIGNNITLPSIFTKCNPKNYLPLYFEPFIGKFSQKHFVYKSNNPEFKNNLIVTGDCDQDRPSI